MFRRLITALLGKSPRALIRASKDGDVPTVQKLLDAGVPVDAMAGGVFPLFGAAFYNQLEVVRLLRASGASLELQVASDGTTALHALAQIDANAAVCEALLEGEKNVDLTTELGVTPLMLACKFDRLEMVNALLAHGADINARVTGSMAIAPLPGDVNGFTPVVFAIHGGNDALVAKLLRAGAVLGAQLNQHITELVLAVSATGPECVQALVAAGANPNAAVAAGDLAGVTPLMAACAMPDNLKKVRAPIEVATFLANRVNVIHALVDLGANTDTRSPGGKSAVDIATENGLLELFPELFKRK